MNNYIEYFANYVNDNYDMSDPLVKLKFFHSVRVAKMMVLIAKKMNMSEEDTLLAFKIGLCHDLGRFYESVINGKFDNVKFDHGTYSNKILYNDAFIKYMDVDEHLLFRKAIYNHNKKDVTEDLNSREKIFVNMLRDADKLDILAIRGESKPLDFDKEPTSIVLNNYLKDLTIDVKDLHNMSDRVIIYLSFIKDLYFDISYDMAINYGYLNTVLNLINVSDDKKDLFNNLIDKIYERRGKVYVR